MVVWENGYGMDHGNGKISLSIEFIMITKTYASQGKFPMTNDGIVKP